MEITRTYLEHRFGLSRYTIRHYVKIGLIPAPSTGRHATYPPETVSLLRDLELHKEYLAVSQAELAERRQLTGRLLPLDGRRDTIQHRGTV